MAPVKARTIMLRVLERAHIEGGASIRRPIGPNTVSNFMPFLLLDDIEADAKGSGFGDHPHRGQETMTYIMAGSLVHQDSKGNEGTLNAGDFQAMRAGRGIVHSEVPIADPEINLTKAIQIWVALPEKNLNDEPGYKDIRSASCPVANPSKGVHIKVIFGDSFGKIAPIFTRVPVCYFDITLEEGGRVQHPLPKNFNAFILVLEGAPSVAGEVGEAHETFFLERDGDFVEIENRSIRKARLLLVAGDTLDGQEVHRYGPFISTSSSGIDKAIFDYRMQLNGFENTHSWTSKPVRK